MDVKSRSGSLFQHQENKGKHGRKEARNHLRGPKTRSRIIFQHKKKKEKQRARSLDYQFKNKEKKYKGSCEAGSLLKENGDKGSFKYYVINIFAFFDPTHPLCNQNLLIKHTDIVL